MRSLMSFALAAFLVGCADPVPVNVDRAQLMPDPVARRVLQKYVQSEWINNPYFPCPLGSPTRGSITSIVSVRYVPFEKQLYISDKPWGEGCRFLIGGLSQESANEITAALVSLGARTDR